MRSFEDILKAKDSVATSENTLTVADLLPGYLVGGSLEFISEVAYIAPVAAAVQGKRIEISEKIRLEDCYWEVKKLNNYRYYVYLDTLAVLHVDVRAPMIINKMMGLYHPSTGWRYINTFYSNNVGRITETTVSTLNIIGYSGDGTPYAPQEGDRRVYIDEDEIRFEEYTGGAWTSVNSIVIGGADSYGNFLPFLGCRGIYNTLTDPPAGQVIPSSGYSVYEFENNYENQNGDDDWDTKTNLSFTASSKFGSYAVALTTPGISTSLIKIVSAQMDSNKGISAWVMRNPDQPGTSSRNSIFVLDNIFDNTALISVAVRTDGQLLLAHRKQNTTPASDITDIELGEYLQTGLYYHVSLTYTASTDTAVVTLNEKAFSVVLGGSWDLGGYLTTRFSLGVSNFIIDDAALNLTTAPNYEIAIQHYVANIPWNTEYTANDLLLKPAPGGAVKVLGDLDVTGDILGLDIPDPVTIDTNTSLGTSDTVVPSQNAVKTYVDNNFPVEGYISEIAAYPYSVLATSPAYITMPNIEVGQKIVRFVCLSNSYSSSRTAYIKLPSTGTYDWVVLFGDDLSDGNVAFKYSYTGTGTAGGTNMCNMSIAKSYRWSVFVQYERTA